MNNRMSFAIAAILALALQASPSVVANEGEQLVKHSIGDVPNVVMSRVREAAPDVFFEKATSYWLKDFRVYRVTGRLYRTVWNVYVREDGKLLRTESDNQDG